MSLVYTAGDPDPSYYNVRYYDTETGSGYVIARDTRINAIATDRQGNLYFGDRGNSGNAIWKYDADHNYSWNKTWNGYAVRAVATDRDGNAYFGGDYNSTATASFIKYASDGTFLWKSKRGSSSGDVFALATDLNNYIYVGGTVASSVTTHKYNSSGAEIWTANHGNLVTGIVVDSSSNVYTCGFLTGGYSIRKYNSTGTLQWSAATTSNATGIALDSSGNIYTCCYEKIQKFTSSGTEVTAGGFPITASNRNFRALKVDSSGNIYAGSDEYSSKTLIKYDSSGSEVWSVNHGSGLIVYAVALYEPEEVPGLPIGLALGIPTHEYGLEASLPIPIALGIPSDLVQEPPDLSTESLALPLIVRCFVRFSDGHWLEYPLQALQCRRRRNDSTWLYVTLPGITVASFATLETAVGYPVVLFAGYRDATGQENLGKFLETTLESCSHEQNVQQMTAQLTCRVAAINETLQTRVLAQATNYSIKDGQQILRSTAIHFRLRPGDTVQYQSTSFVANNVNYRIEPDRCWMEVEEAPT